LLFLGANECRERDLNIIGKGGIIYVEPLLVAPAPAPAPAAADAAVADYGRESE
jgi:hypothetical protein